jgi:iron complex transport system substrate-binding protein
MRRIALLLLLFAARVGGAGQYVAVDATGARVTLAKPAQRIASLSPHATELVAAAGAGGRLVAVTQACDFPAYVEKLPRIASAQGINIEALIAVKPDLVIVWPAGNRPQDIERLRALGIPLFASQPETLAAIAEDIEKLGALSGTAGIAHAAAQSVRARLRTLGEHAAPHANTKRVFYQLGAGTLYTLNDKHPVMEVISRCGGRNVFGHLPQSAPQVSIEAVLNAKPQIFVLADVADAQAMRAQWQGQFNAPGRAVAQFAAADGRLLHRPTPRLIDAAQALCAAIRSSIGDNKSSATLSVKAAR